MITTAMAMEPTKSPAGPGSKINGVKESAVVTVDANSGANSRLTDRRTASTRAMPLASRWPTSSVITMPASTKRPSATMRPVTDI
jgi:hypothetical protein